MAGAREVVVCMWEDTDAGLEEKSAVVVGPDVKGEGRAAIGVVPVFVAAGAVLEEWKGELKRSPTWFATTTAQS